MTRLNRAVLVIAALVAIPALASAQALECEGEPTHAKAVALPAGIALYGVVDFNGSGGQLDPTPLLQTEINVVGARGHCVIVTLSSQATPQDNSVVFQVSIDDVPMTGHGASFSATPIVYDPEESNLNASRMVSYTFFAQATSGTHTIRVRVAGCCSSNPTTVLAFQAATLVVRY